ncbi:MAG: leucine-rich repeat domain-containing protein [Clostridia bacterium]|nr:leucine-rich repeat domain-containing protein [Clostridia bacterium]
MSNILHLPSEETLNLGLAAIKTQIQAWTGRIAAKLGAAITKPQGIEPFLSENLSAINTQLAAKGSTAAAHYSAVPAKIGAIVPMDDSDLVALIAGTLTEITNENVTTVRGGAFLQLSSLTKIDFPNLTTISGNGAFQNCKITEANIPKLTRLFASTFLNNNTMQKIVLPSVTQIDGQCFQSDTALVTVLLRKRVNLGNSNAFVYTPFRNGTGGTVYCQYADVSWYPTQTNWSALESTTFAAIEENLAALQALGIDISNDYIIVSALPTSDIASDKVYFIETAFEGIYEQWFHGSGSWVQLSDITLGGSQ